MRTTLGRRRFVKSAIASSAATIVPRAVLGGEGHVAPSEKLTLAHIGMGTQGFRELGELLADPAIQIVAVCDPNRASNDYIEWSKGSVRKTIQGYLGEPTWRAAEEGCPGGREIGREVVEAYYAKNRGGAAYRGCAAYADFRELFERVKDLDAVKIMTPDHLHTTISIAALARGKHVLMHKPLGNRLDEGRRLVAAARTAGKATHLLAYGSGKANGLVCREIAKGAIGRLREIHNWTNRPVWPQYAEIPAEPAAVPDGFDWQLWLGPERDRPYHPHYTHTVFRGWYDFGGGSMADMGIYSLWPVFTTLELGVPTRAAAWATHACTIVGQVSQPIKNNYSYPTACNIRFRVPRKAAPDIDLFWYDGGMKPRLPEALEAAEATIGREGILFVGDEGSILADFHGENPQVYAKGRIEPLALSGSGTAETGRGRRDGEPRHRLWLNEIRTGERSPGSFLNAAAITDAVNLGSVALRAGGTVSFDSDTMKATGAPGAQQYLYRQYREGWEL